MGAGDRDGDARSEVDARLTGLLPDEAVELEVVEARRRRLYVVGGIAVLGLASIAALALWVDAVDVPVWAGPALLASMGLFVADAWIQERTLSELTRTAVAQQQRGVALEAAVTDLAALHRMARRVNSVLLPEQVYDVVLDAAVDLLRATGGSIRLRVADQLTVAASTGAAPEVGVTVAIDEDPAVVVVTLGVDIVEDDPPRLAVPITVGARHVGVLEVQRDADAEPFTPRLALLARLFAEEAANAFVNANRYDHERSRAEVLSSERETHTDAVADAVHDLRAPLSGLLGYTELLRDRFDRMPQEARDEAVAATHEAATQLKKLIDELFATASAEATATRRREPIAVEPLLRNVASTASATTVVDDAHVEVELRGTPVALGDPEALLRVLHNLVGNAIEHGSPRVLVRADEGRREVRIHVTDTGPGIPADQLEGLFRRRVRTDGSPRGRGLPIVDGLVRAMGGTVAVRSQEGVGSVFTVRLPGADARLDGARVGSGAG